MRPRADRHQIEGEHRKGQVGRFQVRIEFERDQPGQDQQEDVGQLEKTGEDRAKLAFLQILGAKRALDDELVDREVVKAQQDHAPDAHPRQEVAVRRQHELGHLVGRVDEQLLPAADPVEADPEQHGRPDDQQDRLHGIGDDHGRQPAEHGIKPGDQRQHRDRGPKVEKSEHIGDHEPTGIKRAGRVDEDDRQDGEHRKGAPGAHVIAVLEEFGHRRDLGAQIGRQDEDGEKDQHQRAGPFPVVDGNAVLIGAAKRADEARAGHVGGVQRKADQIPRYGTTGEEVLVGAALELARNIHTVRDDADEVDDHDRVIDPVQIEPGFFHFCLRSSARRSGRGGPTPGVAHRSGTVRFAHEKGAVKAPNSV